MLAAIRKANFIIAQGGPHSIQRAARALSSSPLAPLNAVTIRKLHELHPIATEAMGTLPDSAVGIAEIDADRLDSILRKRVHNGSAPGLSGTTGSHLLAMWDKASKEGKLGFQLLIRDICNGVFDGELKQRLLACVLVPLAKKDNGVRPVAVAEVLVRCAAHYSMSLIEDEMRHFFPKIQFGVKLAGGSEAAAQLTRAELAYAATKHADVIVLKIDFKNAFNAIFRARVWAALRAHPKAAPILKAFFWQYSDASPLLIYERGQLFAEMRSSNGVRQGCPFAAFAFALTVQPLYEASLRESPDCNGFSIQDDFTVVGPSAQVMRAYDYLKQHAQSELGLELVTAKCQVYIPPTVTAAQLPSIHSLCTQRQLTYASEMESLGVMFGPLASVVAHCDAAVDASEHFFACVSHPSMPVQTASLLLRYCAIPKLGYLARTVHPDMLLEPSRRFDKMALKAQLTILQQTDESLTALEPRTEDPDSHIHDPGDGDPPPGSQPPLSTARVTAVTKEQLLQRISLPLSLGGLGLRSVESIRHAAYFASLQQILPYFAHLHPELRVAGAFQQSALYAELQSCQAKLIQDGAANAFDIHAASLESDAEPLLPLASQPPMVPAVAPAAVSPSAFCLPALFARASAARSSSASSSSSTRFPSPSIALTQSIDDSWQRAVRSSGVNGDQSFSAVKLQHDLTRSIEATAWIRLFNSCGRYQQATLTSLSLNPSTSAWLSCPPLTSEPGYRIRDEEYRLAIRHRLGQLPFDDLRDELCTGCARLNVETPSLLDDPDHVHSCALQKGVSVKRRHDTLKMILAELARSCGYFVEVEPRFPATVEVQWDPTTGERVTHASKPPLIHGDLLLVRHNVRQLIDVTVVRPTTLTLLRGSSTHGAHLQPLVAAAQAESRKHVAYDNECARHGWKMVPFAMESLGAKGKEATRLLQQMSAHCRDKSPVAFLAHADRLLSSALQVGNADVSAQGAADLFLHGYRDGLGGAGSHRGPGQNQLRRTAAELREEAAVGFGPIVHADYRSVRNGPGGSMQVIAATAAA